MAKDEAAPVAQDANVAIASGGVDDAPLRTIVIRCGECRSVVDRVEYRDSDVTGLSRIMATLGTDDEDMAREFAERVDHNLVLTQEEVARNLVDRIIAKDVPDRDPETYVCANGHSDAELEVSE